MKGGQGEKERKKFSHKKKRKGKPEKFIIISALKFVEKEVPERISKDVSNEQRSTNFGSQKQETGFEQRRSFNGLGDVEGNLS